MNLRLLAAVLLAALALGPQLALAQPRVRADAEREGVERHVLPEVDPMAIRAADEWRVLRGAVPHYAVAHEVAISPWSHGTWEPAKRQRARWRLRIASPGALSLNLAFDRYRMPGGGRLDLYAPGGRHHVGPFTELDNEDHGQLWTPPIAADELILDLSLPVERLEELELELAKVHHGYAGFGELRPKSGECHLDVACPEAEPWSDQARAVALVSIAGVRFCTGVLVNNTALDGRPLFLTARHCGVEAANAPSVVVMWNHQRRGCGEPAEETPGYGSDFQTGAVLRASSRATDMVLLELDDPPDPAFGVYYAGWDRSPVAPERPVVIHHPNTDVKRIGFDFDRAVPAWHLAEKASPRADHLRIVDWEMGTTEGGSSGAPLFNRDKRVVGQLHGGHAACGNRRSDWFGRLAASWTGQGRPGTRLSDWLDPIGSGATTLDGLDGSAVPER